MSRVRECVKTTCCGAAHPHDNYISHQHPKNIIRHSSIRHSSSRAKSKPKRAKLLRLKQELGQQREDNLTLIHKTNHQKQIIHDLKDKLKESESRYANLKDTIGANKENVEDNLQIEGYLRKINELEEKLEAHKHLRQPESPLHLAAQNKRLEIELARQLQTHEESIRMHRARQEELLSSLGEISRKVEEFQMEHHKHIQAERLFQGKYAELVLKSKAKKARHQQEKQEWGQVCRDLMAQIEKLKMEVGAVAQHNVRLIRRYAQEDQ